jgi:peroxiredoxin
MKRTLFAFLCLSAALFGQAGKSHLKVGDIAPDFKLNSSVDKPVTLSEFKGKKNVILAFFPLAFTGG